MRRVAVVLGLLISFAASNPSLSGIRWDWTAEEVACAQTIDVKLGTAANPDSPTFVSYLTWLSDAVVIGRVTEIRHSLQGDFPTIVVVSVDLVRKGENIPATLEIVQNGGPHFSTTYQQGSLVPPAADISSRWIGFFQSISYGVFSNLLYGLQTTWELSGSLFPDPSNKKILKTLLQAIYRVLL